MDQHRMECSICHCCKVTAPGLEVQTCLSLAENKLEVELVGLIHAQVTSGGGVISLVLQQGQQVPHKSWSFLGHWEVEVRL